jgi:alpha-1,3-rhamnosyl/mannosyltransferase
LIAQADSTRIGFDARLIGALGIGRYISGLLPELAEILGGRLTVISQARDAAVVRALLRSDSGLLLISAAPYRLAEQSGLPVKLSRAHLDLVHFPHYNLPFIHPGRFLVTVHDLFPFEFPEIHSGPIPRTLNRMLMRSAIRRARAIITPSGATAAAVTQAFPAAGPKVYPIPEAADARFNPSRDQKAEAAWQDRLGIQPPYVLYLGQWKAYKNLPLLLDAFKQVRQSAASVQLVLAGRDPRHPEVPRLARALPTGSVVLPGRIPEAAIPDLYRGAAAVVLPSRAEGFGLPVLEAMACGVPVVCSDLPVLREIADGVATFCDPQDPSAFARAILQTLQGSPDGARRLGIARAGEFSWRRAAEKTVEIYERVLAAGQ